MNITLDGYLSGPDHELDWHLENWSPDMGKVLTEELGMADTILLGRNTYQAMAAYWPAMSANPCCARDDLAYGAMMNEYRKVVYSTTLKKLDWENSRLIKGDIGKEIRKLKQPRRGQDKNIITYGSGRLVTELMRLNLIDEYQLWVHPVILGKGRPLFAGIKNRSSLRLIGATTFNSGVILLRHELL